MDQIQKANSPISGSLFDRFNWLHTIVLTSRHTECRIDKNPWAPSLSLFLSLPLVPFLSFALQRCAISMEIGEGKTLIFIPSKCVILPVRLVSASLPLLPSLCLFTSFFYPPPFGLCVSPTHTHVHPGGGINSLADIHPRSHSPRHHPIAPPLPPSRHLYCLPVV